MKLRFLFLLAAVFAMLAVSARASWVYFSSAPSPVGHNQGYYVVAVGDSGIYGADLTIYKNNSYFTAGSGYGYSGSFTVGNWTSDGGPQTIQYRAEIWDYYESYMSYDYASVTVNAPANNPPVASVVIDGYSHGATITRPYGGSVNVTVRYRATDANGNLSGIRPQVWEPGGFLNNNGGNFVGQSGGSGEVAWTVTLNQNGNWYFWTDATDSVMAPGYVNSGPWGDGFRLNVVEAPPPNNPPTGGWHTLPGTLYPGTVFTGRAWGHDNDGNLTQVAVDVSVNGGGWTAFAWSGPGNGYDNISTANTITAGSGGTTYQFRYFVSDPAFNSGWQYSGVYTVAKFTQTITFPQPAAQVYGGQYNLNATASSGLAVTYTLVSGPATLSPTGQLTFTGTGTNVVVVKASQAGNANYEAAADVQRSITVNKATQTITFPQPPAQVYGGQYTLPASASSGLGVSYAVSGPATYNFGVIQSFTGAGTNVVVVTASQGGNANYEAAADVQRSITVNKADQTITFPQPADQTYPTPLVITNATATSTLTVTFSVVSGPATVNGNTINFTGQGDVTIKASQGGSSNYNAAPDVPRSFNVAPCPTTFSLSQTSFTYNGLPQGPTIMRTPDTASFTPGGTLTATNVNPPATPYNATATATNPYTGSNSSMSWSIVKATPQINNFASHSIVLTAPGPYTVLLSDLSATLGPLGTGAPTGSISSYKIAPGSPSGTADADVNSGTVLPLGTYVIRASYAGDPNYLAAIKDVTWEVTNDVDHDGVPGYIETQLGTDPNSGSIIDDSVTNAAEVKRHRPAPPTPP